MTDQPMTLRERIESYVESLGGEMDGFELTQDGLRAVLDAVLTETVIADTERDRLARIGELVEGLLALPPNIEESILYLSSHRSDDFHAERELTVTSEGYAAGGRGECSPQMEAPALLDALEALGAKVKA